MEFDIESAIIMLEDANNLLLIYTDFYETECPTEEKLKTVSPMDALAFASSYAERSRTYFCLIDTARDKIRELITQLNEAINDYLITKNNSVSESNVAYNEAMEKYRHLDEDTQKFVLDMVERLGKTEGENGNHSKSNAQY